MTKLNLEQTPYIVRWFIGSGYYSSDVNTPFATIDEAIVAYNGPRPSKQCAEVLLCDWRIEQPFVDLRKTCLARRKFDFNKKTWIRYERKLQNLMNVNVL
jgi:hypothetical protein